MTPEELILYYVNLLIIQYADKPKARAHIELLASQYVADMIANKVLDGFNLDTAIGAQLDMIGSYRGVERTYAGLPINQEYFQTPRVTDDPANFNPYARTAEPPVTWLYNRASYAVPYATNSLNDEDMRKLIKFCAKVQNSTMSVKAIDDILYEFFGDTVLMMDNLNMTMDFISTDQTNFFNIVNFTNNLPIPSGVSYSVF